MGHFGAQAARPGPEPGRAGRKTIILVGSFGADRLQHPRLAHICQTGRIVVVPGLPLPMSLASRSGIHPCHQRSDAIFRQRRHSDAGSRQRIGRQFEPAALRVLAAAEAMLVHLRGGRPRTANGSARIRGFAANTPSRSAWMTCCRLTAA